MPDLEENEGARRCTVIGILRADTEPERIKADEIKEYSIVRGIKGKETAAIITPGMDVVYILMISENRCKTAPEEIADRG